MRYPLLAFFFVLVMPPFALHALLVGKAQLVPRSAAVATMDLPSPYFSHMVITR